MASQTSIEWTATVNDDGSVTNGFNWNFLTGCSRKSSGCENCYAEKMTKRLAAMGQAKYQGLLNDHGRFNGTIKFNEKDLLAPLKWKKPRRVFVNSMSDLFHENVKDEWLDKAFAVMALTPHITYQCLTKRPARMLEYFQNGAEERVAALVYNVTYGQGADFPQLSSEWRDRNRQSGSDLALKNQRRTKPQTVCEGLSTSETGVPAEARLFACDNERGQETDSDGCSPASVGILQRTDTGRHDDQPQKRYQERQPTSESGTSNLFSEPATRSRSLESESSQTTGEQTPKNTSDGNGCVGDSAFTVGGNDGERFGCPIQNHQESDVSNLHSPDLEAYLKFPLKNCWLGVSVEDQKTADERILLLLQTPAAVRWISAEPLLGPIEMYGGRHHRCDAPPHPKFLITRRDRKQSLKTGSSFYISDPVGLDWVVVGGESGPRSRPFDIQWARDIIAQCKAADVPVFYKQGGSSNRCEHSPKGGCFDCFPDDLKVRNFPNGIN